MAIDWQRLDFIQTIFGDRGDNTLTGARGSDNMIGRAGDDTLNGRDGDDRLNGGSGNDLLKGGGGQDLLLGGRGEDDLRGGDGDDKLDGGRGADQLRGGDGHDLLFGGSGADDLRGGDGADHLYGGAGSDQLDGGAGIDMLSGGAGRDVLDGGAGSDTLSGGAGRDSFRFTGDPFDGAEVDPEDGERQIIGGEDDVLDFEVANGVGRAIDRFEIDASDFGIEDQLVFASVDANDPNAEIPDGANVIVLLNSEDADNPDGAFLAGTAANQIAELVDEETEGLFIYFNSNLQLNRLVYSTDLSDASADLKIVARDSSALGQDAIDELAQYSAGNFDFI